MQSLCLEVISLVFELDIVNYHFIDFLNVLFQLFAVALLSFVCVYAFVSIHASLKTMTVMT